MTCCSPNVLYTVFTVRNNKMDKWRFQPRDSITTSRYAFNCLCFAEAFGCFAFLLFLTVNTVYNTFGDQHVYNN